MEARVRNALDPAADVREVDADSCEVTSMAAAEGLDGNGLSTGVYLVVVQVIAMAIMGFITWKSDKNSSTKKQQDGKRSRTSSKEE